MLYLKELILLQKGCILFGPLLSQFQRNPEKAEQCKAARYDYQFDCNCLSGLDINLFYHFTDLKTEI